MEGTKDILPDVLGPKLNVVICGMAAGKKSAVCGCYYADPHNRFWRVLYKTGLTLVLLKAWQFRDVLNYGIGLTDLVKDRFDRGVKPSGSDVERFCVKVNTYKPKVVAFNGKGVAEKFFHHPVDCGGPKYDARVSGIPLFILPQSSGVNTKYWDESYWNQFAHFVQHAET